VASSGISILTSSSSDSSPKELGREWVESESDSESMRYWEVDSGRLALTSLRSVVTHVGTVKSGDEFLYWNQLVFVEVAERRVNA
jgi:hypothetical protein